MTDEAVTEVRTRLPGIQGTEARPLVTMISPEEWEAYRAYTDLVVHARDYEQSTANRRLRLAEQLMVVIDQMWSMLPRHEDDPSGRPQELAGRIAQLRNLINTEHALNGRRRA
jgi:hypothetical protein